MFTALIVYDLRLGVTLVRYTFVYVAFTRYTLRCLFRFALLLLHTVVRGTFVTRYAGHVYVVAVTFTLLRAALVGYSCWAFC